MSKLTVTAAAALFMGSLFGASPAWAQQQRQGGGPDTSAPQSGTQATGACRVKDLLGGQSCTGDVPEAACAAIAREAKGQYTWGGEECP